ncbi:MAG: ribokinase [Microgenomates group bacterium Gr01-1014_16]|nr:MAG: ribokinase [Microgenomates group bacterium Gr01-1014_16]
MTSSQNAQPTITVIGGLTMDVTYFVKQWPKVGEAVQATTYKLAPGGKGLNQATAVSRSGAFVHLIASVGSDEFADRIISEISSEGISPDGIFRYKNVPTDLVGIIVNHTGSPGFIGIKNSTIRLSFDNIKSRENEIKNSQVMLINSEVSLETIEQALELAKKNSVITIYNPAPPEKLPDRIYSLIDYLVLNMWEAQFIAGSESMSSNELTNYFKKRGVRTACITLGRDGCVVASDSGTKSYSSFPVDEVDETGAGDSFCGYFAHEVALNRPIHSIIRKASAAGAIACTKQGSRSSPTRKELEIFMKSHTNEI